jgi:hypothetical protein
MKNVANLFKNKVIVILFGIFLFSFILDLWVLTRYNLSYGIDGPFYDIQVLNIIKTGFPNWNYPPIAYYLLTPFVILAKNSFLCIKIGMSFLGSLMVFPTYFLSQIITKDFKVGNKIIPLLSAFLITINPLYFSMIGNLMKNLIGILFLMTFSYFIIKWFENIVDWKKYGVLTTIFLLINMLTHIYTGSVSILIFLVMLVFTFVFKSYKNRSLAKFELKILGLISAGVALVLGILLTLYPIMLNKFITVLSLGNSQSQANMNFMQAPSNNGVIFLTIPFILGILVLLKIFYDKVKTKEVTGELLSSVFYLIIAITVIILSIAPIGDHSYQNRFLLLGFVPLSLISPLCLNLLNIKLTKIKTIKGIKLGLASIIIAIFLISSVYASSESFSSMKPTITDEQYNILMEVKNNYVGTKIDSNGILMGSMIYWSEYILGLETADGNITEIQKKYPNRKIYSVSLSMNRDGMFNDINENRTMNPLIQYLIQYLSPYGGYYSSQTKGHSRNMMRNNSTEFQHFNSDRNNQSSLQNNKSNNMSLTNNLDMFNRSNGFQNNRGNQNRPMGGFGMNSERMNSGTLIFNESNIEIYEIG